MQQTKSDLIGFKQSAGNLAVDAVAVSSAVGEFLEQRRRARRFTTQSLAGRCGVAEKTIRNYEKNGLPAERQHYEKLDRYMKELGILPSGMNRMAAGQLPLPSELVSDSRFDVIERGDNPPAVFNLGIAASGWVELTGEGWAREVRGRGAWVIIRVAGDSMEPRFDDGQFVMFRRLNLEEDEPVEGSDYFFVRNDDHGTLKRVVQRDEDGYTLQALNPKYKERLTVSRQELVMVAEAAFVVNELPHI
jgi:transcriptional regulator with XRE-family HTH domain